MVWNYHDDDIPAQVAVFSLNINSVPARQVFMSEYRIDNNHSNSYELWIKMGSPQNPTREQIKSLESAGLLELYRSRVRVRVRSGELSIPATLPRQGVSLFCFEWK